MCEKERYMWSQAGAYHVSMYACMCVCIHASKADLFPKHLILMKPTCIHAYIHTHTHTYRVCRQTASLSLRHLIQMKPTCIHAYIHTHTYTHIQGVPSDGKPIPEAPDPDEPNMHTYTHTYTHTYRVFR